MNGRRLLGLLRRGWTLLAVASTLLVGLLLVAGVVANATGAARAQEGEVATESEVEAETEVEAEADSSESDVEAEAPEAEPEASGDEAAPPGQRLSDLRAQAEPVPIYQRLLSLVGLAFMIFLAWTISLHRDRFPWRIVGYGVGLQLLFAVFVLWTPIGVSFFSFLNDVVSRLLEFTQDGSRFLFGDYLDEKFTVALDVLPTIIFFSSLMSVLYHAGVMQRVVKAVAWVMQRTMKTSGAETLSAAANIFVGQTEAPLVVKPFVDKMTQSELMAVMSGGFATVAGGVLAAYVGMLNEHFPDIGGHLISASVLSAPASLLIAKVVVPETEVPETAGELEMSVERPHANLIDAAAGGAGEGLKLALNVGAMLLAFLALVAMVNFVIAMPALWHNEAAWAEITSALGAARIEAPESCGSADGAAAFGACVDQGRALLTDASVSVASLPTSWTPWSLQRVLGYAFWPLAFVMGVPVADCATVASLLGEKLILNEFVAYVHLAERVAAGELSHRAIVISTYALCGFANLGSIAIQIGGIGSIAPGRRKDLARLGVRAMLAGTLAAFMTACVAGAMV